MLYQIVSICVEVHLLQHSRLFTPLNGQLLHPSFIYAAVQLYKTQTVWTPGGPNSSSVFPRVEHRRSVGIALGWEEAFYKVTPRAHPTPWSHHILTPLYSPVPCMIRSKVPAIRLRHLLAQDNTHMAFSWMLPEGQRHDWPDHGVLKACREPVIQARAENSRLSWAPVVDMYDLSYQLFATPPSSVRTCSGHQGAQLFHFYRLMKQSRMGKGEDVISPFIFFQTDKRRDDLEE